jgi:hypothetical protein
LAPLRFKNTCNSTARCAQDAKHAKKDTKTNICLQGIAFFLIIRPDQEKTKIQPWRPWRLVCSKLKPNGYLFSVKLSSCRKRRIASWASSPSQSFFLPPGLSRGTTWCNDTVFRQG